MSGDGGAGSDSGAAVTSGQTKTVIIDAPSEKETPAAGEGVLTTTYKGKANNYGFGFDGVTRREKRDLVNSLYNGQLQNAYTGADAVTKQALGA